VWATFTVLFTLVGTKDESQRADRKNAKKRKEEGVRHGTENASKEEKKSPTKSHTCRRGNQVVFQHGVRFQRSFVVVIAVKFVVMVEKCKNEPIRSRAAIVCVVRKEAGENSTLERKKWEGSNAPNAGDVESLLGTFSLRSWLCRGSLGC
jgi:hypothetical protein